MDCLPENFKLSASRKGFEINTEPTAVVVKDTKEKINNLEKQSETKRSTAVYITMASPEAGDYIKLCAVVHKDVSGKDISAFVAALTAHTDAQRVLGTGSEERRHWPKKQPLATNSFALPNVMNGRSIASSIAFLHQRSVGGCCPMFKYKKEKARAIKATPMDNDALQRQTSFKKDRVNDSPRRQNSFKKDRVNGSPRRQNSFKRAMDPEEELEGDLEPGIGEAFSSSME